MWKVKKSRIPLEFKKQEVTIVTTDYKSLQYLIVCYLQWKIATIAFWDDRDVTWFSVSYLITTECFGGILGRNLLRGVWILSWRQGEADKYEKVITSSQNFTAELTQTGEPFVNFSIKRFIYW